MKETCEVSLSYYFFWQDKSCQSIAYLPLRALSRFQSGEKFNFHVVTTKEKSTQSQLHAIDALFWVFNYRKSIVYLSWVSESLLRIDQN